MKKFTFFCLLFLILFGSTYSYGSIVFADNTYYGRALASGIYLYSSPEITQDKQNRLFEIPPTYFVFLLGDENDLFYRAQYNGIYGFVLKNEMSCVAGSPNTPFVTNATFRVFTPSGANLRSTPSQIQGTTNLVTSVPFMETNLMYYGTCEGEEAIPYKGNIWYYCKYAKQEQEYYGYIYAPLCDMLTQFPQNTEQFEYVTPNFTVPAGEQTGSNNYLSISNPWQIIIIVLICLPCIAIIYFLFKPTSIAIKGVGTAKTKRQKRKKKISKLKHSDYYELDSDYFD